MSRRSAAALVWSLAGAALLGCPSDPPYRSAPSPARDPAAPLAPAVTPPRPVAQIRRDGNHLKGEPSPYLEQHAHNPVDWYPWGDEAIARAKREQKPIFLSIGYSTCHWCHVMEKESFEDDSVAEFLNTHFVAIKVDREQRPDVDALYIDAVRELGGDTGWPLTVFLTPDLEPFYGGTYYPPTARRGRPGFMDVLREVKALWAKDGSAAAKKGQDALKRVERLALAGAAEAVLQPRIIGDAMTNLERSRDRQNGGFGGGRRPQRFPNSPLLLAQLRHISRVDDASVRNHLVLTLEQIMRGGIRDHLGGTFHRYSVDPRWHLPHFEKTLYDNAQLAGVYIEAGRTLKRPDFVAVGRAVLDDIIANWQRDDGGIIVGFDADDPEGEGVYYSWTPAELTDALGADNGKIFAAAFGVTRDGDKAIEGRSVLHRRPDAEVAQELGIAEQALRQVIDNAHDALAEIQRKRPPPAPDDKELVAWNGLAIMALADAGRWLDAPEYIRAAEKAAAFILDRCNKGERLLRGFRAGQSLGPGFLDDYALAGLGLVRLHAATGDARWLEGARALADAISRDFFDAQTKVFMQTPGGDEGLPVRMADMTDGVLPSGGSAAALLALELGAIAGDAKLYDIGSAALSRAARRAQRNPFSAGFTLVAIDHATAAVREVVVAGALDDPSARALWAEVAPTSHARILPVRVGPSGAPEALVAAFPALEGKRALKGGATAFVCERGRCEAPAKDPATLRTQLQKARAPG